MVKRRQKGSKINLLPQEGFAQTTTGRILFWLLSSFRIIVIITEIIVMVAFLSRFWLDAQSSDLNDEMQQKSSLIASSERFEREFRDTKRRLMVYSELTSDEINSTEVLSQMVASLPTDVLLNTLSIRQNTMSIDGTSPSEKSIQQFIVNLESKDYFTEVTLNELGTDVETPSLLEFTLSITF